MIRRALGSNQVQLIFVTSKSVSLTKLVKELTESFPEIVTIAVNYNYSKSSEIYGQETENSLGYKTLFKKRYWTITLLSLLVHFTS